MKSLGRARSVWKVNSKDQPSPVLERLEEGEIVEQDQSFTTVVGRNRKGANGRDSAVTNASARPGSIVQRTGKTIQANRTTPYPLLGSRLSTTQSGAVDMHVRAIDLSLPARPGMVGTVPAPLRESRLAPSYAPSQASMTRSAVYSKTSYFPTVAGHQGPERTTLRAQRDLATERAQYQPGMIIHAALPEPDWRKNNSPTSQSSTASAPGDTIMSSYGPIFVKTRPMIVVALQEKHYIAVPCYTHSGKGIGHRNPDEYITVHDHRSPDPPNIQSRHPPLVTSYMYPNSYILSLKCTAHTAYPVSRQYSTNSIREGYLTKESTLELIQLCQKSIPAFLNQGADREMTAEIKLQKRKVALAEKQARQAQETYASMTRAGVDQVQGTQQSEKREAHQAAIIEAQKEVIAALDSALRDKLDLGKGKQV